MPGRGGGQRERGERRNGSVTAGEDLGGVRPSSGAAMIEREGDTMNSGTSAYSVLAAPEDGRTPIAAHPSSLTHYGAATRRAHPGFLQERRGRNPKSEARNPKQIQRRQEARQVQASRSSRPLLSRQATNPVCMTRTTAPMRWACVAKAPWWRRRRIKCATSYCPTARTTTQYRA
jgi:hypothetical protein